MFDKDIRGVEMKRRFFLKLSGIFAAATFFGIPLPGFGKSSGSGKYPGRVMPFDDVSASGTGPWAG